MNRILRDFFSFLLFFSFFSCGSQNASQDEFPGLIPKGKVISGIHCKKDSTTTYSVYFPGNLSSGKSYPLILAFDPAGSGALPLELYHELAEKYGYIMVGSEDSRNGLPISTTSRIISSLFSEIRDRFPVDTNRIYTLGFSGGARIASLIGLYYGGVSGVIGCGAGFAGDDVLGKFKFDYIGFAGTFDFNMNEMIRLNNQLEQNNFSHAIILLDGIHEWPSGKLMKNAFIWNECCAMRKSYIPMNSELISQQKSFFDSLLKVDKENNDMLSMYRNLRNTISFFNSLSDISTYSRTLNELEKDPEYIKQSAHQQQMMEREFTEQNLLQEEFFFRDLSWWRSRISDYDKRIRDNKDISDLRFCKRVKSYLSLLAYLNYNRMIKEHNLRNADLALHIYQIVDPENASKIK